MRGTEGVLRSERGTEEVLGSEKGTEEALRSERGMEEFEEKERRRRGSTGRSRFKYFTQAPAFLQVKTKASLRHIVFSREVFPNQVVKPLRGQVVNPELRTGQ